MRTLSILIMTLALCFGGSAFAQAQMAEASPLGEEPIDISSDTAHVDENSKTVVLDGNVIATQGAVQLRADTVTVHYLGAAAEAQASGKIDRLEATGNVIVTRPGEVVKGAAATYKMIEKQIVMTGNVIATRGANVVRGDTLIVDLAKDTIKLQSSGQSGRVRAIFKPPTSGEKP